MTTNKNVSIIIPSYKTPELLGICVRSFERFKPEDVNLQYVIVENSTNQYSEVLPKNIEYIWLLNPAADGQNGSIANAMGIQLGLQYANKRFSFLTHSDTMVVHAKFYEFMINKMYDGNRLVGVSMDPQHINAAHMSGILTTTDNAKKFNMMPVYSENKEIILDACDILTLDCQKNKIRHYICNNTLNDFELYKKLRKPYKEWGPNCGVDRCVDDKNCVIFLHLGRGTPKSFGLYTNDDKFNLSKWIEHGETILNS